MIARFADVAQLVEQRFRKPTSCLRDVDAVPTVATP
jgi:hypothetical protein